MKPRLILHAGTHKTGTTAIQAFAARHRAELAGRGTLYPDLTPIGIEHSYPQHRFAHALADKDKSLGPADAARVAGLWAEAAARDGATAFLSAEPLYRYGLREGGGGWREGRARYLDRLTLALAPFEVEAVLVFRRPDDYVRSLYQENVMRASRPKWPDFAAFRAQALGGPLRYAENAALFAERFAGPTCLVYEDLPRGSDFAAAFFAAIGLDAAGLAPVGVVRASLSPAETRVKLFLNETAPGRGPNGRVVKWLKSPQTAALTARHLGPGPFGLWESEAARAAFLAAAAPEMERLRAERFPGRATLFPPDRDAVPPAAPPLDAAGGAALTRALAKADEGWAPARRATETERTMTIETKGARIAATPEVKPEPRRKRKSRMPPPAAAGAAADGGALPAPIQSFALIVGAMKSGTTSLYYYLAAHPAVAAGSKKEPDFFASTRNWQRGPEAYFALWPDFDPDVHRYALEASTNYAKFPQRKRAPQRMKALGDAHGARFKFLYILRNPIDRIESHIAHNIARSENPRDPGRAIDPAGIEGALAVSRYALQLRRYLRCFPREDLLLLDFDDLRENPHALMARAFGFLGLETPPDFAPRPPANPRRDANGSAAFRLDEAARAAIRDALRDDVTELRDRFGVEVGRWDIL